MSETNLHRNVIEDCLAYFNQFESEGISAYEDSGDIYVTIRGFDIVQISKAEAVCRADMYWEQYWEQQAEAHAANVWGRNPSV